MLSLQPDHWNPETKREVVVCMGWLSVHVVQTLCVCARVRVCLRTLLADSMYIVVTATFLQLSTAAGSGDCEGHTGC